VKRCFGVKTKEEHDPLHLIAAYENPDDKIWQCGGTGMHWREMDKAVQQAIAHRRKLGPLPKPTYDKYPLVVYYYDNDKMKRITYPGPSIPAALNPNNVRWWAWGAGDQSDAGKAAGLDDVHTRETDDPKKIGVERVHPGWTTKVDKQALKKQKYPWLSDMESGSAGDWSNEQFTWDKDVAGTGVIGTITGAILALVSAILDATGVGAVVGVPLGVATPFIVAAINATDTALHAGDFGAALANLGPAMVQASINAGAGAAGAAGFKIPPAAMKALGGTVSAVARDIQAGQQKKLEFGDIWAEVAKKAQSYGKLGDDEAEAIATMLGGPGGNSATAGHVFIQGYLAGKFLDMTALKGIAKILTGYATFADPRVINIALLGMGIGYLTKAQGGAHAASGGFDSVGQIFMRTDPRDDLAAFVHLHLMPRYGLGGGTHFTGLSCPEGYDLVASDHEIACAYRKKASCLGGSTGERGTFVCSDWDYPPCPPGMSNVPGSPKNWCFPVSGAHVAQGFYVGDEQPQLPDYSFPALGCLHGQWRDPLNQSCRPIVPSPPPHPPMPHVTGFGSGWDWIDYSQTFFPAGRSW